MQEDIQDNGFRTVKESYLGIWRERIECIIKMHMDDMARKIVKEYEKMTNKTLKE